MTVEVYPEDIPYYVRLYRVGGIPVSVGKIPGCPHEIASWGDGGPKEWKAFEGMDRDWLGAPKYVPQGGKQILPDEFRELITLRQAGY